MRLCRLSCQRRPVTCEADRMKNNAMNIENDFDISLIASLALKEKQIQQNYRPIIAVHKWFARRPGTLFRG